MLAESAREAARSQPLTLELANYWSRVTYDELPADVVRLAKRCLLDTLAAGVAGSRTHEAGAVRKAMQRQAPDGGAAVVWGCGVRLPAGLAALANGTAAHARELDDYGVCGHAGSVVIPAALAAAGASGAGGKELLVAIAAGYDVASRVMKAVGGYKPHKERGWHSTGTCGGFGAAAAAARLLGLGPADYASALGISGSFTGGTWAFLADGAETKRLHAGKAAETGVTAAFLAAEGLRGPGYVLEAEWGGFLATYGGDDARPEAAVADLGRDFGIRLTGVKPYACCRGIHGCLDAYFQLVGEGVVGGDGVEAIVVHGSDQTRRQLGSHVIEAVLDAQMSLPYALAVAMESGRATLDQFDPPRAAEPRVVDLIARVQVVADRTLGPDDEPALEVRLPGGRSVTRGVETVKGSPQRPLTDAELQAKARSLLVPVLGAGACERLIATLDGIEERGDLGAMFDCLRPGA